ncbi:hypothetical protein OPV22_001196 [Ensete ventricosum]|uniref:Uncharacterized protein n=1 Tax=Ensete ventricosum TaxID=4639 RepID=A0AAV8RPR1_ENSVE|nr:hypothetical protein OPV22_001196 [Ensete ventricosum]
MLTEHLDHCAKKKKESSDIKRTNCVNQRISTKIFIIPPRKRRNLLTSAGLVASIDRLRNRYKKFCALMIRYSDYKDLS